MILIFPAIDPPFLNDFPSYKASICMGFSHTFRVAALWVARGWNTWPAWRGWLRAQVEMPCWLGHSGVPLWSWMVIPPFGICYTSPTQVYHVRCISVVPYIILYVYYLYIVLRIITHYFILFYIVIQLIHYTLLYILLHCCTWWYTMIHCYTLLVSYIILHYCTWEYSMIDCYTLIIIIHYFTLFYINTVE